MSPKVCLKDVDGLFDQFMSLAYGREIDISEDNISFFREIALDLELEDLCSAILQWFEEPLRVENVFDRIFARELLNENCCSELKFVAENFCRFPVESLAELGVDRLYLILSLPSLVIESEDWLFSFICSLLGEDRNYFCLLEFVHFEFLSRDLVARFVEVSADYLDLMNVNIWQVISRRLIDSRLEISKKRGIETNCPFENHEPLSGILSFLAKKHGGNVHDMGIINVSHSGWTDQAESHRAAKNACDIQGNSTFWSIIAPSQWICYDFRQMRIKPTYYSIRSQWDGTVDGCNLKSWVVECSKDEWEWVEMHRVVSSVDLNDGNVTKSWALTEDLDPDGFRYIRIRQLGKNHEGRHQFAISSFEVFGTLIE
jgi:hypothetical protein